MDLKEFYSLIENSNQKNLVAALKHSLSVHKPHYLFRDSQTGIRSSVVGISPYPGIQTDCGCGHPWPCQIVRNIVITLEG